MSSQLIDLRPLCPPVYDQGDCAADSACALVSALEVREKKAGLSSVRLSRLFLYYNQRVIENSINDNFGAKIESGIKSLTEQGCCNENLWPYDASKLSVCPPDACYKDALLHRVFSPRKLDGLGQVAASLSLRGGCPVVFSMTVYESFQNPSVEKTGVVDMPGAGERYFGSMAVLAVGFDDTQKRLVVRNSGATSTGVDVPNKCYSVSRMILVRHPVACIANSYSLCMRSGFGPAWGQAGYFTLPYDYVSARDMATDFWTLGG